ncbi:hypothetical protein CERSUDRAFT_73326 [Gelatoporia subvermispora B]|uniref:Uncharacterized protein n=1 Tax=Ceriporiopsis subvermispora (strain B) TaxID=914234 RepID=M2RF63_CERS8|nr:hypothetical protein CERSUDRAFT_73326 [Gelatoporia subvermispora B]
MTMTSRRVVIAGLTGIHSATGNTSSSMQSNIGFLRRVDYSPWDISATVQNFLVFVHDVSGQAMKGPTTKSCIWHYFASADTYNTQYMHYFSYSRARLVMSDLNTISLSNYDQFFTVPQAIDLALVDEVRLIWGCKLTSVTLLFYVNRWAILLWALLQICGLFELLPPASCCVTEGMISDILVVVHLAIWSFFSAIRTHAISLGNWRLTTPVLILTMAPAVIMGYCLRIMASQMVYGPEPGNAPGWCRRMWNEATETRVGIVGYSVPCLILGDVLVLAITWWKTYHVYRLARTVKVGSPLSMTLLRDGTIYFRHVVHAYSLQFTISDLSVIAACFCRMSSIIVTHFLLDLRQAASQPQVGALLVSQTIRQSPTLHFASFIDNMGEELTYCTDDSSPGVVLGTATVQEHETVNSGVVQVLVLCTGLPPGASAMTRTRTRGGYRPVSTGTEYAGALVWLPHARIRSQSALLGALAVPAGFTGTSTTTRTRTLTGKGTQPARVTLTRAKH